MITKLKTLFTAVTVKLDALLAKLSFEEKIIVVVGVLAVFIVLVVY